MELEEVIENLKIIKEFAGDNYTFGQQGIRNLKENLQVVLNHLAKQEKMIELTIDKLDQYCYENYCYDEFCQYEPEMCNNRDCKECIKQYFEKKAEESE